MRVATVTSNHGRRSDNIDQATDRLKHITRLNNHSNNIDQTTDRLRDITRLNNLRAWGLAADDAVIRTPRTGVAQQASSAEPAGVQITSAPSVGQQPSVRPTDGPATLRIRPAGLSRVMPESLELAKSQVT